MFILRKSILLMQAGSLAPVPGYCSPLSLVFPGQLQPPAPASAASQPPLPDSTVTSPEDEGGASAQQPSRWGAHFK